MTRRLGVLATVLAVILFAAPPAWAQCGVYKTWALNEILTSTDLNNAFSRTVTANIASCATGDSPSVGQMRVTVDPYPGSSESLATTVQGELERMRFQLKAIVGKTYWYQVVDNSLASGVSKHWGATFTSYYEIVDPTSPGPNVLSLYAKDDGAGVTILAYKDSAGAVTALTGPSSSYGSTVTINLSIIRNAGAPTTKLDLSADRISAAGRIKAAMAVSIDCTTTGANALDTGALANNSFYYVWVIVNPAANAFAGLASLSETAPTMPIGYTLKRLVGGFRTGGAATFLDGIQKDYTFFYTVPIQVLAGGTATSATSIDLTNSIPASMIKAAWLTVYGAASPTGLHWVSWAGTPTALLVPVLVGHPVNATPMQARLPAYGTPRNLIFYGNVNAAQPVDIYLTGWEIQWKD